MRRAVSRLALLLALGSLILAACGDDGAAPATTNADGTGTTAAPATTAGPATTAPAAETTVPGGNVDDLLQRYRMTPLRTTYLMGEDRTEMTFSQDPTANPPVAAMISMDGKAIFLPDSMIFCSGEDAGAQCFEMPTDGGEDFIGAMMSPWAMWALTAEDLANTPGFSLETDPVTIAGRSGVCFTFRPDAALASGTEFVRQCVDNELGFTLLLEVKETGAAASELVMELTAMGQPEPDDFEPTGPVMPLPTG